ncbi:nucleotidyltransferase family protein [Pseudoalteromonas distincta]|uniref:nucleotidyltransferase family protein n=1 Tax=Pseudoalteromonas distincta TaxID=77608 RepID=UPI0039E84F84
MDKMTELAVNEVVDKYNPHTIIIYGSRARGDATDESDVDMACFLDSPPVPEDFRDSNGIFLDAWLYPTESMQNPVKFAQMGKAFCAIDRLGYGAKLLQEINVKINEGPVPLNHKEKRNIIELRLKTLKRVLKGDLEGNHRRTYLQFNLLETYFHLRDKWFFGSKSSLTWLKENDHVAFTLFESVYNSPEDYEALKKLTMYVTTI